MTGIKHRRHLGRMLLVYLLAFSSFVTLIMTGAVLYSDYQKEVSIRDSSLLQIQTGYLPSLAQSLWNIDELQMRTQLEGVVNFPYVVYVEVSDDIGSQFNAGSLSDAANLHSEKFDLIYHDLASPSGQKIKAGLLNVFVDTDLIHANIFDKALVILITQFVKTLTVSLFLLWLVSVLVTRHLHRIVEWADMNNLEIPLVLNRLPGKWDELERVTDAINSMRTKKLQGIKERDDAYDELDRLNTSLELQIDKRTSELHSTIKRLDKSIDALRDAQKQLVESEKMAQLGGLVAGVAHELNTPLGICITARSFIDENLETVEAQARDGNITQTELLSRIDGIHDGLSLIEGNLARAKSIVNMFKGIAVDKGQEKKEYFNLLDEVEQLQALIRDEMSSDQNISFINRIPPEIELLNYLLSFDAVINALIANSIEHGFKNTGRGEIRISAWQEGGQVTIRYQDDGLGIGDELIDKIFDPFFTTERNQGKTGLGMHITFNLVNQILGGHIRVLRSDLGACFELVLPLDISEVERFTEQSDQ